MREVTIIKHPMRKNCITIEELIERLQRYAQAYPGTYVALDESNDSINLHRLEDNGGTSKYVSQVLLS